jgi:hypothetical protein
MAYARERAAPSPFVTRTDPLTVLLAFSAPSKTPRVTSTRLLYHPQQLTKTESPISTPGPPLGLCIITLAG